jgi:malonate transporter
MFQSLTTIFGIIFVGFLTRQRKILTSNQVEGFEVFLFKIAMPCYFFTATLNYDIHTLLNTSFILSFLLTFISIAVIVFILYRKHSKSEICINMLASGYSGTALYTIPIITVLFGNPIAGVLVYILHVVCIQSIFITILSFITLKDKSLARKLATIITTPLIIMPIVGMVCNYIHISQYITYPTIIIKSIGNISSGLALFTFGLNFYKFEIDNSTNKLKLLTIICLKNIAHPLIAFVIGHYIFHLEQYWLYSLVITASAPTAFLVYLISKQYNVEQDTVKIIVILSSIVSLASLILITFLL